MYSSSTLIGLLDKLLKDWSPVALNDPSGDSGPPNMVSRLGRAEEVPARLAYVAGERAKAFRGHVDLLLRDRACSGRGLLVETLEVEVCKPRVLLADGLCRVLRRNEGGAGLVGRDVEGAVLEEEVVELVEIEGRKLRDRRERPAHERKHVVEHLCVSLTEFVDLLEKVLVGGARRGG